MKQAGVLQRIVTYALLTSIGLLLAAPFIYMLSIALASDKTTAQAAFTFIPRELVWHNFVRVFTEVPVGTYLFNSIKITVLTMVGTVLSSSMVAYGFARLRAPGRGLLFVALLSTMMLPGEVTMIPQFILFRHLNWIDTHWALIVPSFFGGAFNVFLIRQFIMRIPRSLDEAAQIDGLGHLKIYMYVIMPMIMPVLAAVAIFAFSWSWGNFMGPLIYISSYEKMPLALGVQIISSAVNAGSMPPWNLVMVASLLLTIPMIIVYFVGQRYIYEANITGGSAGIK